MDSYSILYCKKCKIQCIQCKIQFTLDKKDFAKMF